MTSPILTIESASPSETEAFAQRLGALLRGGDLVLLEGELGAGKTCLTRGLARGLGADAAAVSSPTYVIAHEHPAADTTLVHVDAYRLGKGDDLEDLGVPTDDAGAVLVVEWASRLWTEPPVGALRVQIEHAGEERRRLTVTGDQAWAKRLGTI